MEREVEERIPSQLGDGNSQPGACTNGRGTTQAERWQGTQAYVGFPGANGTGMEVDCGQSGERKAQGQQTRCLPQGRRRRRGPRKKASSQAEKVGFLNMQGGRTEQKWGELVKIMHEEHFALMAVAETHLRDQEVPPSDTGFAWEGCNRQNGERRGGGLGCMWRLPQQWTRIKAECSEHMWLSGNIAGRRIALAVVYLWTGAQMQKNTEICQCLRGDVEDVRREAEIIIMGDFNAHLEDLDGRTDANGRLLQELACSAGLVIANLTEKCCGMTTWSVRDQQSCIDYCLLSESLYEHLQGMVIDEDGKGNLASDHNRIQLIFKGGFQQGRSQRPAVSARPNEKALQQMAAEVEEHADTLESYDILVEELRRALKEWKPGTGRRRGLKPWWNGEVAEAIRHRQEASRAHRHLSRGGDTEAILRAWDVYRTRKLEAATLVQSCIRAVNQRFMADLKSAGKQAPQRFWRYIKRQDRPTPQRILRQASDGEDKTGKECLPLLEKWIESLQQRCDMEGVPINAEGPYTWPVAEEQTSADLRMAPTDREIKRAMKRVDAGTAPGCDGLPMSLIKALGPKAREKVGECVAEALLGMAEEDLGLLQAIYRDVVAEAEWEGHRTKPLAMPRGLRQGCPLSPVIFMVYVAGVVQHLERSGCGYTMVHSECGRQVTSHIPTLVYADDFALLAGSAEELQGLLDICAKEMSRLRLRFSPTKCVVMTWGRSEVPQDTTWRLQDNDIHRSAATKYLGVRLTAGADYLSAHEKELRARAARYKGILCRRALWSYNRYEVMRALWKMVAVPGLTYANAVLCLSTGVREFLERRQREIGRLALGVHKHTPVEAIQGEMGWSSFTAREAVAKAGYENRLVRLPEQNVARRMLVHTTFAGRSTRWTRRTAALRRRFGLPAVFGESKRGGED
ncbi:hypothetical protein HPB52_013023 [Rhipicephalus sanguineus]|uniref:Reverse transcriptase domain-containing protein n=1 Tax=Rhipicephalus sanguineus TaxID=34632 RepID=A0A9D4PW84_RHISA|nr:hypothetical protein HPB52_013023 [Rhipicephalus sanguineus]